MILCPSNSCSLRIAASRTALLTLDLPMAKLKVREGTVG